jgi:hypothetical protein
MLVLLVSGQRPQILKGLKISNMVEGDEFVKFTLQQGDIKQGRPGYAPPEVILAKFHDCKLCVYRHIKEYIRRTARYRDGVDPILLTTKKPFKVAMLNTISRWIKDLLRMAGVNIDLNAAGSTRAAATSKAAAQGAPITEIMASAGWTRESTFTTFYRKPIQNTQGLSQYVLKQ